MFSDTHFHFNTIMSRNDADGSEILTQLANRDCFFAMDIGTRCEDLKNRIEVINNSIKNIKNLDLANKIQKMIFYSAGIWPDTESIKNRFDVVEKLKKSIENSDVKIIALGECGLDHHWNPSGVDERTQGDFDSQMYLAEKELFCMQLEYAKSLNLPVIIHSRDAFEDTLDCIKNVGYHNGIIHCYSYGLEEAKAFLDLGWHISFSGSITYTKKTKLQEMKELLCYVPEDMILCETDAPYLAPVPFRGVTNTPVLVEHVYKFVADARGISAEKLSDSVDNNIKKLFNI